MIAKVLILSLCLCSLPTSQALETLFNVFYTVQKVCDLFNHVQSVQDLVNITKCTVNFLKQYEITLQPLVSCVGTEEKAVDYIKSTCHYRPPIFEMNLVCLLKNGIVEAILNSTRGIVNADLMECGPQWAKEELSQNTD